MTLRQTAACFGALFTLFTVVGCTSLDETYSGVDRDQVWTAMVGAAESPSYYPGWFMTKNNVWADEAGARIEINRELRRDLVAPGMKPQRQERDLQFTVTLLEEDDGSPLVNFVSRHIDVPAKAVDEARWYFDEVWDLLGGRPATIDEMQEDFSDDEMDDTGEMIDIEDVE